MYVTNLFLSSSSRILPLDLSDPGACSSAPEKALKLFGRVDILINNAGMDLATTYTLNFCYTFNDQIILGKNHHVFYP